MNSVFIQNATVINEGKSYLASVLVEDDKIAPHSYISHSAALTQENIKTG